MKYTTLFLAWVTGLILLAGCELEEVTDPNNPDVGFVSQNATRAQLNTLTNGIFDGIRRNYGNYVTATGSVARELYLFNADPRNTGDLLGKNGTLLDNNTFYLVGPYNDRYRTIKTANVLLDAVENTELVSEAQKNGYRAFAKTMQAHQFLQALNMLGSNGIRVDVTDPDNLGGFVSQEEALTFIANLLDEAATHLAGANAAFAFTMHGFEGFNTPTTFLQFNRALAARVAAYRQNWQEVLNNLDDSFLNLDGSLTVGPKMIFSTDGRDLLNPVYRDVTNTGDMIFAQASFASDAEAGDSRVTQKTVSGSNILQDGLTGIHRSTLYSSAVSPIDIIRNEELILLYAEAQIQLNNLTEGKEALDIIRNAHGLSDYSGSQTKEALIDQMLVQRRYSLWAEGHRMVDLRRYGLLNSNFLPIDRPGDQVFTEFPRPATENVD